MGLRPFLRHQIQLISCASCAVSRENKATESCHLIALEIILLDERIVSIYPEEPNDIQAAEY